MGLSKLWSTRNGNSRKTPPPLPVDKKTPTTQPNVASIQPKAISTQPNGTTAQSHSTPKPANPPEPVKPSEFEQVRMRFEASLASLGALLKAMKAPLPTGTGNGAPLPPEQKTSILKTVKSLLSDMSILGIDTIEKVGKMSLTLKLGEYVDDREYLMEYLIRAAAELPNDIVGTTLTDNFVTTLWNDLQHPPQVLLSDEFIYRTADGSNNSYLYPKLGAARQPYARTVKPSVVQSAVLPDPGVLFDTLMAREEAVEHPNKISSMLFYLASIIIHDLFRTSHDDYRISDTSSYLDLSPLYGSDWKEQKRMRTFKDGKILPDCFSETRLLAFPPGVGTLLIMFNRFHNYTVEQLASINEGGRFTPPSARLSADDKAAALEKYDNDLFQTGRLITCGLYINIVLIDYVRTILNLNRTDENWQLNPRIEIPNVALGTGNQVSAEFNLVYRWHSAVSDRDDKWTRALFAELFDGRTADKIPQGEFLTKLGTLQMENEELAPNKRDFNKMKRQADGTYNDDELAAILIDSIEDCANAFGPRQVPAVFRQVEILGIRQARAWSLATLNEFRKYFALKPYAKFSEITSNKEVAAMLEHLYDTPDQVELYPGLVVEDAKEPKLPGSGLCPSYTTSRAVLSDAVALVRGDRFYTTSYHPKALTNWGFTAQNFDVNTDNGCVFYKLLLRGLPNNFEPNSVYAHYPLTVPSEMQIVLTDLGKDKKYDFRRPGTIPPRQMTFSYAAATQITEHPDAFHATWHTAIEFLMGPASKQFMLCGEAKVNAESRSIMEDAMYMGASSRTTPAGHETYYKEVSKFYENITEELIRKKSFKLGNVNQVDMIRDVGNMAHVHFCAAMFSLPLKTEQHPHGIFTEYQLYLMLAAVFTCVFFDVDPVASLPLRSAAHACAQQLGQLLELEVATIKATGSFSSLVIQQNPLLADYGIHMIQRLLKSGKDIQSLVWGNIMGTAGGMVANQGQLFGQILDFLFTEPGAQYRPVLHELALADNLDADLKLMRYMLEFSRLAGETAVSRECVKATTVIDGDRTLHFQPGDRVMVNLRSASRDPKAFPDPDEVRLDRPLDSYIHLGHGLHQCLGSPMTQVSLTAMLKTIFKLEGLEAAPVWPGPVSSVKKVVKVIEGVPESWCFHGYLTEDWESYFPFPTSLKLQYKN